ncbi:helix-turn-helix domain-containing protein (plasmid) [Nostoc sp. UHCC 0302]|uniref:helix-turn-helix domain-containing protein n=1 Tax=Nostoc sp. UHCC 0302 TaxID=3134896 RepID=UPI00311C9509
MIIKTTKWTEAELTILEAKAELYTPKQIASILKRHGYFRTPDAISTKLWNLGYSTRPFLDNYSAAEIARILCVHRTTVSGWVRLFQFAIRNSQFAILFLTSETGCLNINSFFYQ